VKTDVLVCSAASLRQADPKIQLTLADRRIQALSRFSAIFEDMLAQPYFLDEMCRSTLEDYIRYLVTNCETLILTADKEVVGAAIFSSIVPGRDAQFAGWVDPSYRLNAGYRRQRLVADLMREEVLPHAWNDLKLLRLESRVCIKNRPAIKFAMNAGFAPVGKLNFEFMTSRTLFDTFLLEAVNPALRLDPLTVKAQNDKSATKRSESEYVGDDDDESFESDDESPALDAAPGTAGAIGKASYEPGSGSGFDASGGYEDDEW
jgi:RimJ/RimL family protein N-acetyltransferase